jgi:flavin reductase (DIM6/NTAB) family NADH-FMN oxidoreductase RutF
MDDRTTVYPRKVKLKAGTLLAPVPVVMLSTGAPGDPAADRRAATNIMTVAWTGIINTQPPMLSISIRPERYSCELIRASGEFVINLVNRKLTEACDFCGVRSGREVDKFAACNLTAVPAAEMQYAPALAESPVSLSCRVVREEALGSHSLFLAEISAVEAAPELLDDQGALHFEKADLISYMHGSYYALGDRLGFFGYSIAAPAVRRRRLPNRKRHPDRKNKGKSPRE